MGSFRQVVSFPTSLQKPGHREKLFTTGGQGIRGRRGCEAPSGSAMECLYASSYDSPCGFAVLSLAKSYVVFTHSSTFSE